MLQSVTEACAVEASVGAETLRPGYLLLCDEVSAIVFVRCLNTISSGDFILACPLVRITSLAKSGATSGNIGTGVSARFTIPTPPDAGRRNIKQGRQLTMNIKRNAGVARHIGSYSDGVEIVDAQRILYVSGTPGIEHESGSLPESFAEQAALAWINVIRILGEADMAVEDIVKLTQHLVRRDDLIVYRDIRSRYLGDCAPASMLTILPGLVWPNMLIELEVVAAR
jgi:2-iminobutanoate/2-iminopropanoate deaminase